MSKTIHWGIIGLGKIAHKFAQDLTLVSGAKLHAVASTSTDRAKDFADQYQAKYYFSSYEGILNCPYLDVVYVATPHTLHKEIALMCLKKGIPVLCEKPFGMNRAEVQTMVDTARKHQTFLMEAMWTRFMPSFQHALQIVRNGEIGEVIGLKADFGFHSEFNPNSRIYNKSLGGGSLLDVGLYPAFAALMFLGKPQHIQAMAKIGASGIDESCAFQFQYASGAIAMMHSSVVTETGVEASIYGEKGRVEIHGRFHHSQTITKKLNGQKEEVFQHPYQGHGYHFEAKEVMNCLKNRVEESSLMTHQLSLDLIEVLDSVRQEIGLDY
jgi:predicted dehydrogenase